MARASRSLRGRGSASRAEYATATSSTQWASVTATPGRPIWRANSAARSLPGRRHPRVVRLDPVDHPAPSPRAAHRLQRSSRGSGRTGAGSPRARPAPGPPRSSRPPAGAAPRRARGTAAMRSPSAVLISSPTITVSPSGAASRARERPLDPVVVGDREVGEAALGRGAGRRSRGRRGSRSWRRVTVQVEERREGGSRASVEAGASERAPGPTAASPLRSAGRATS